MTNAKRDKPPTLNVTNHPRYQTVVELLASAKCGCGSRADVIQDGKGYFCAACWVSRFTKHA